VLALFSFEAALLGSLILRHTNYGDVDGMYHAKMAWLLWHEGFRRDFPWMTCSITATHWADHHFLFHVLLAPLAPLGLVATLQLGAVLVGALGLTACIVSLARSGVRHLALWAVVLPLCSDMFLYRTALTRAMPLCLALTVAFLAAAESRRPRLAGALAFVALWTYQGALFLLPLAAFAALRDRLRGEASSGVLLATIAGMVLGLTVNPFFPATWDFLMLHVGPYLSHGRVALPVDLGIEWQPATWSLVPRTVPVLVLGGVLPVVAMLRRRWSRDDDLFGATVLLFAVATVRSQRFVEYAAPLGVMLGARVLSRGALEGLVAPLRARVGGAVAAAALVLYGAVQWRSVDAEAFTTNPDDLAGAAHWLRAHTPPGAVVFHGNWTEFAGLFYHNHHNRYVYGLDPYFFLEHDPALYLRYRRVIAGQDPDAVGTIVTRFHSRHVVLVAHAELFALARQLRDDPRARLVFQSPKTLVFALGDGGAPR